MRRKTLNVVFDEGVTAHADRLVDQISLSDDSIDCTVNRSEILRCAMDMGLSLLQDKVDSQIKKGMPVKGLVKVANLKAMLRN